jgi:hypothetical protein
VCPTCFTCARSDEIADALSVALRYQGRKRVHRADDMMPRTTAERLVNHLEASGFVMMKGPPCAAPSAGGMPLGEDRAAATSEGKSRPPSDR